MCHSCFVCLNMCVILSLFIHDVVVGCFSSTCVWSFRGCVVSLIQYWFHRSLIREMEKLSMRCDIGHLWRFHVCRAYVSALLTSAFRSSNSAMLLILFLSKSRFRISHVFLASPSRAATALLPFIDRPILPPSKSPWVEMLTVLNGAICAFSRCLCVFPRIDIYFHHCIPRDLLRVIAR